MPRKKATVPQRLTNDQREEQNWNLGESSSNQGLLDLINDEVEDYNSEEDEDFIFVDDEGGSSSKISKNRKKKRPDTSISINKDLEILFEASEYHVNVSNAKKEEGNHTHLGEFEFEFHPLDQKLDMGNIKEYSIYLSTVPKMSFVYVNNELYSRLEDVSTQTYNLLKAFEVGMIGTKRRKISLVHKDVHFTKLTVDVMVFEFNQINHPSDVIAHVPNCKNSFFNSFYIPLYIKSPNN